MLCVDFRVKKLTIAYLAYAHVGLLAMYHQIQAQRSDTTMPKIRKLSVEEAQRLEAQPDQEEEELLPNTSPDSLLLEKAYPYIAAWVDGGGWIELGQNEYSRSFIHILDIGGMLWEGTPRYRSLDSLLNDAETALIRLEENGDI